MLRDESGIERVDRVRIAVDRLGDDDVAPAPSRIAQKASCSRTSAGCRLLARQPYSFQSAHAATLGRRTSTRRSGSTIERQP